MRNVFISLALFFSASSLMAQILAVPNGGTGQVTLTPYGPLIGNGTGPVIAINPGTAGQCLVSGGPNAPPAFAACPGGGGGGGGGITYNVPSQYPTVQAALSAAIAAGSGPVSVSPEATDTTAFTNPTGMRVMDFRQTYGMDSLFFHSVDEWGVKHDAKYVAYPSAAVTAGSPTVTAPSGTFSAATDIGKVFICYGCGTSSQLAYPASVTSGGTGGQNGMQQVTFAAGQGGCTTPPTGYVSVSGGAPTGNFTPVQLGTGCTSPGNSWVGQVATVTGTTTFSGGNATPVPLITTIIAVPDSAHATLATIVINNGDGAGNGVYFVFGTDDTAAWNSWGTAMSGVGMASAPNTLGYGHTTFCGFSIITGTIKLTAWGGMLEGCGWGSFNGGYGAKIISAQTTSHQPMIDLQNGEGAQIARIHFFGNILASPIGLQLTHDSTLPGVFIGSYNKFTQLWFGPMYDGSPSMTTALGMWNLYMAIKANGLWGNADYNRFETTLVQNANYVFDSVNANATDWDWQTLLALWNGVGFCGMGDQHGRSWIFGGNGVELMAGSCTNGGNGNLTIDQFITENAGKVFEVAPGASAGRVRIKGGIAQSGLRIPYDGVVIDATASAGQFELQLENFNFTYYPGIYSGTPVVQVKINNANFPVTFHNVTGIGNSNVVITPATGVYAGLVQAPFVWTTDSPLPGGSNRGNTIIFGSSETGITSNYRNDFAGSVSAYAGGVNSLKAPTTGYFAAASQEGTAGSTAYNYAVACVSGGHEGALGPTFGTTNGNAILSSTNYIAVYWGPLEACDSYNVYGDRGSGGLGYLTNVKQGDIGSISNVATFTANGFRDDGSYTKGAPYSGTDYSGRVWADNGFMQNGQPLSTRQLADVSNVPPGDTLALVYNLAHNQYVPSPIPPQAAGIVEVTGGVASSGGYTTIGGTQTGSGTTSIGFAGFTPTVASRPVDCKEYVGSTAAGSAYCAIYDSDGTDLNGQANAPGTRLCYDTAGGVLTANGWSTLPSPTNCPVLSSGHKYFLGVQRSVSSSAAYDSLAYDGTTYFVNTTGCCNFPPVVTSASENTNKISRYIDLSSIYVWGPSYAPGNPIPANYLGAGASGTGNFCLLDNQTWGACSGSGGGGSPIPINSLLPATGNNLIANANWAQVWQWALTSTNIAGLTLTESTASTATIPRLLQINTIAGSTTQPLRATAGLNSGLVVDASGNVNAAGGASFVGPVRMPNISSAPSLATDVQGNIIAGTGGGGNTAWSSIGPAASDSSVALANWRTVWQPSFAGDTSGGTSIQIQQAGTTGTGTTYTLFGVSSTASNVSPAFFTNNQNNGLRIDSVSQGSNIRAMGVSKFLGPVQLTGLNSAASLATDPTGNIIAGTGGGGAAPAYSGVFTGVSMGAVGPITLAQCPGFTGGNCPAITPSANTTYRLFATVTQTQNGSGCSGNGTIQLWISYIDADSGYTLPISAGVMSTSSIGAAALSLGMNMGNTTLGNSSMFNILPLFVHVQQNSTFQFRIQQTVTGNCTTQNPQFTLRVALFPATG